MFTHKQLGSLRHTFICALPLLATAGYLRYLLRVCLPCVHVYVPPMFFTGARRSPAADEAVGGRRHTACSRQSSSSELPAWKKTAEEVETPNELCVGDVVRAR